MVRAKSIVNILASLYCLIAPIFASTFAAPVQIVASSLDQNALFDNTYHHLGIDVDTPEELALILSQIGRLAPGHKIRIIWASADSEPDEGFLDSLKRFAPEGSTFGSVNFHSDTLDEELELANESIKTAVQNLENQSDVDRRISEIDLGRQLIAKNNLNKKRVERWREKGRKFRQNFSEYARNPFNLSAMGIGLAKTGIGIAVWLSTGLDPTLAKEVLGLAVLAASSGAVLDFSFQAWAQQYVDFKRNLALPLVKSKPKFKWYNAKTWLQAVSYSARKKIARFNSSPWLKAFSVDNVVGTTVSGYFREIRHRQLPGDVSSPFSGEWAGEYFGSNLPLSVLASGSEMKLSSLVEKGVLPRSLAKKVRWAVLQMWGLSFWGRNTLIAIGFTRFLTGKVTVWSIFTADLLSRLVFIAADKVTPTVDQRARRFANQLPRLEDGVLDITIMAPNLSEEDRSSLLVLNDRQGLIDLNITVQNQNGENARFVTRQRFEEILGDVPKAPESTSYLQQVARSAQKLTLMTEPIFDYVRGRLQATCDRYFQ